VLMFQRLLAYTAETFAPLTERVFLNVVNGNHDEAQHDQNTYPGNGWANVTPRRPGLPAALG
jgi:predicted chitinase